ncbi:Na+/H+ antiporter subunit A [Rhodococcus sp. X156]|uniref:Na+/H+ antiporter subunit A n=1 Tax=Rhodococcus sp. X156 TaxID=2499145 RepID=UPI000FD782DE|nr:Na+/H+ antiporter subunit A [Rhodococcus sp. X156]
MLLLLIIHAAAALLAPALVRWMGRRAFLVLAAVPAAGLVWSVRTMGTVQEIYHQWIPGLDLNFVLRLDPLASILCVLVTGVGALVLLYCSRYFDDDEPRLGLFAGLMVAFAGAMYGLVLSDNMLLLYMFWELTTVLSFLLVGHYASKARSRRAATQALLVTTGGGLAMLVGIVILGRLTGSYLLSDVVAAGPGLITSHSWLTGVGIVLVLVGALSKSAIVPLHFWLPGAMAAPTPVSAYLHAAAMVKAGIYLVARLAPGFADAAAWRPLVITLGLAAMLIAGWRSLRENDLKLVLAFGTVSQLGFLTVLVGAGTRDMALAGMAMLVAHALFKATLFLVVGIIDHSTGTRDLRKLSGLGRKQPLLAVVAIAAAASMAGVPPFIGFVGKEAAFDALLHSGLPATWGLSAGTASTLTLVGLVAGSALTVAYSLRFVWGAFGAKGEAEPSAKVRKLHAPSPLFLVAPAVLTVAGLLDGLFAPLISDIFADYADTLPGSQSYHLALWHGLGPALALTGVAFLGGGLLFVAREQVVRLQWASPPLGNADRIYDGVLRQADVLSQKLTGTTQRGSLPLNLTTILLVLLVLPSVFLAIGTDTGLRLKLWDAPLQVVIGLLAVVAALAATQVRNRLAGVLLVGVTGYASGVIFALHGAPDLALTQFLVETLLLVTFVLVLRKLPPEMLDSNSIGRRGPRAALSIAVGTLLTVLGAYALNARSTLPIALQLPDLSYLEAGGRNVVNVLLVDIRAWDTIGEISVLLVAATGVASLVFGHRRVGTAPRVSDVDDGGGGSLPPPENQPTASSAQEPGFPESSPRSQEGTTWLRGGDVIDPRYRSLMLEITARLVFPTIMVLSVYFLFAGHNAPGGGFAGGLVAGLALAVRYLAGGRYELGETLPVDAGLILGLGLLISGITAGASVLLGAPVLSSAIIEVTLPVLGHVKLVTALFFDIGVYLIVIGLVLDVLRSLGAGLDLQEESDEEVRDADNRESLEAANAGDWTGSDPTAHTQRKEWNR